MIDWSIIIVTGNYWSCFEKVVTKKLWYGSLWSKNEKYFGWKIMQICWFSLKMRIMMKKGNKKKSVTQKNRTSTPEHARLTLKSLQYRIEYILEMKILNDFNWKEEKCLKKLRYNMLFNLESAICLILSSFWAQKDLKGSK